MTNLPPPLGPLDPTHGATAQATAQAKTAVPQAPVVTFPDAPAGSQAPESSKALFKAARQQSFANHSGWKWTCFAGLPVAILGGLVAAGGATVPGGIIAAIGIAGLVGLAIWMLVLNSRSDDAFWAGWSSARGLQEVGGNSIPSNMPLLYEGDERNYGYVSQGRIGAASAHLAQYTYTVITHSTDSKGNTTTNREDHDFTVACVDLPETVAARFRQVHLSPNRIKFGLGGAFDKLASTREIQLESVDFDKRFDLRIDDQQDEVALYELFSTTFIDQLSTMQFPIYWQQAGNDLLVYVKGHLENTAQLDALCEGVHLVHSRYSQEWQ